MIFSEQPTEKVDGYPRHLKLNLISTYLIKFMRISMLAGLIFCTSAQLILAATVKAQKLNEVSVVFGLKDESLYSALKKIENNSPFHFIFTKDEINEVRSLNLSQKKRSVDEILSVILDKSQFSYSQIDKSILIIKMKALNTAGLGIRETVMITGDVMGSDNQPIPGVTVKEKNTNNATATDVNGHFVLKASDANGTLVFSFLGYLEKEVPLGGKTTVKVTMLEAATKLNEVVVVGYGTQKRTNITGAVSRITEKEIEERPITRVEQALQGQIAGVSVRSNSGTPGADLTVNVRGAASVSGNTTPLYVVDGVPLDNLSGLNPSDIASIDVLKDASSSAIYGARGSNGVVLVTTKRGKTGATVISLSAYTALASAERKVDVLTPDEWIDFSKKWLDYSWTLNTGQSGSISQADRIAYATSKTGKTYTTRTDLLGIRAAYGIYDPYWGTSAIEPIDWQDVMFRKAPVNDVQLNASGANDMVNYSISGGVYNQDGIIVGSAYKRYSFRANIEAKLSQRVKIGLNLSPSIGTITGTSVEGNNNGIARMLSLPGWVLAGTGKEAGAQPTKWYDGWGPGPNVVSPYILATANDRINKDTRINSAFNTNVNIIKGLDINGLVGWNYRGNSQRTYSPTWAQPTWDAATPGQLSSATKTTLASNSVLVQGTATYSKEIGKHAINALFGASEETYSEETTSQGETGFPNDKTYIFDLSRGTTINTNTIYGTSNAIISYFGRVQYSYNNKYLFAASLRSDGSSKFGPNNRWGLFPSLSAGWILSEEPMFKKVNWLGTTKLRLSWGQNGNDRIVSSQFLSSMAALNYATGTSQTSTSGFYVGNIGYSKLRWEKTDSYNLGLDIGLLKDRISLSADVYYKNTTDLLLNAPVSLTTGFTNQYDNVGSVVNKGLEIQLNTVNVVDNKFKWNTSMNISFNRNTITSLTNGNADIKLGQGNTIIQRVGYPINSYYLLQATGVLRASDFTTNSGGALVANIPIFTGQKPGDTKYLDANNDGKIDANDYVVAGNFQPKFDFGITNTFTYRHWDLSVLLQGRVGGDLLSTGSRSWNRATNDTRFNYMASWLKDAYWSESDPGNGKVPAFFSAVTSQYDTNWMYSAAYLRIKNINLGYNLPKITKVFKTMRLYASCDNVWLFDSYYPGYSPEGATQDNLSGDWGSYPLARTFSLGLNVTF
ncbi:MAG: TonB-dependent receptor [Mucilaginibacter sp.]|uniref:TonB-dependent receptor n=1 Tax=Mucilaginibacter sp. TaxID=1882438 RepID=UPI003266E64D